jgi:hypothetical protein
MPFFVGMPRHYLIYKHFASKCLFRFDCRFRNEIKTRSRQAFANAHLDLESSLVVALFISQGEVVDFVPQFRRLAGAVHMQCMPRIYLNSVCKISFPQLQIHMLS